MIGYEIEIKGLDEQIKKLAAYDKIADKYLTVAMQKSVITIESNVKPLTPVFRGALRNSIGSQVTRESIGSIVGKVGSSLSSEVYPAVMEFGRKPGARMPPPSALERWVHLVLGVSTEEAPGVAYTVARAIGRRGIKGKFFFKRGWEKSRTAVLGFFDRALKMIAEELAVK